MPLGPAALDGIRDNGHRWHLELRLAGQPERLGDVDSLKVGDCLVIRNEIVRRTRKFLLSPRVQAVLDADDRQAIELCLDDVESCEDDPDDLRIALTDLYDKFDYHRIVVTG